MSKRAAARVRKVRTAGLGSKVTVESSWNHDCVSSLCKRPRIASLSIFVQSHGGMCTVVLNWLAEAKRWR